jgi:hypothetical protein
LGAPISQLASAPENAASFFDAQTKSTDKFSTFESSPKINRSNPKKLIAENNVSSLEVP